MPQPPLFLKSGKSPAAATHAHPHRACDKPGDLVTFALREVYLAPANAREGLEV